MNFVKIFLIKKEIRNGIKALKRIKTSLLLVLDLFAQPWPANYLTF